MERGRVVLGRRPPVGQTGESRRQEERLARVDECVSDGLRGGSFGGVGSGHVRPVVLVGEVDDGVGLLRPGSNGVQIVEVAAADRDPLALECGGGRVGAGQSADGVASGQQFVDDGAADPTRSSGDEDVHGELSSVDVSC